VTHFVANYFTLGICFTLGLADHCFRRIQRGAIINRSELAYVGLILTTRMTEIMWRDNFAPDIQEEILFLPGTTQGLDAIKEAELRLIAKTFDWTWQRQMWRRLLQGVVNASNPSQTSSMA
jgi:hypothetical protein